MAADDGSVFKTRRCAALAVCALAALMCYSPAAWATGTLDQSNLAPQPGTLLIATGFTGAQTFTVGLTGTLTEIAVGVKYASPTSAPIDVRIVRLTAGQPDLSSVVGVGAITSSEVTSTPQTVVAHLATAPSVVSGEQYALVLTSSGGFYQWSVGSSDLYPGGNTFFDNGCCGWFNFTSNDNVFATYVTSPAPFVASASPRGAYCSVAGNTSDSGTPLAAGTFVNLDDGQAWSDPHYAGALAANFVQDVGLTCAPPPSGFTRHGFATADMNVDANSYPFYSSS